MNIQEELKKRGMKDVQTAPVSTASFLPFRDKMIKHIEKHGMKKQKVSHEHHQHFINQLKKIVKSK